MRTLKLLLLVALSITVRCSTFAQNMARDQHTVAKDGNAVAAADGAGQVRIAIDGGKPRQVIEGFGATTLSLIPEGKRDDPLGAPLRRKLLQAVYGEARLTMGNVSVGPLEQPGRGDKHTADGNHAPRAAEPYTLPADNMWNYLVRPAAALGLDNYSLEGKINWKWSSPRLGQLYKSDRGRCLEECAKQVETCISYWRKLSGCVPRTIHLFNEPTSGNREIPGADAAMVRDIVKAVGARLRGAGFADVKFVVPNEETVRRSTEVARAILEDDEARRYVAAIGYHPYPYGSPYVSVPRILRDSGSGRPDERSIRERIELRELCARYHVSAWMTEVSHGEADPRSFDHLRGRAIHIHDEMVYADAAAYYGMNALWDSKTHAEHFRGRGGEKPNAYLSEQDTIALGDNETGEVLITGIGYAIGHYARWIKRGAVRLEADSSDPLVQVAAFRDPAQKRLVLVLINNAAQRREATIALKGLPVDGEIVGEQSVEKACWRPWKGGKVAAADRLQLVLPPRSVTSCAVQAASAEDKSPSGAAAAETKVHIVAAPKDCLVPDVAMDPKGALHMVYGLKKDAYYSQSRDSGRTFTDPVKLNGDMGVTTTMGERGPKLAVGDGGKIHVVWQDLWKPGARVFARYTRSLDGGRTFEEPKPVSDMPGIDGTTLTADGSGKVTIFWHVNDSRPAPVPQATWLYMALSTDHGKTFGKGEPLRIAGSTGLACSMCQMRARTGDDGQVYLTFRGAEDNIRDHYVLKAPAGRNDFSAVRVNQDNWRIPTCPMCGPELTFDAGGRACCALMSRNKVYWVVSDKRVTAFTRPVATPRNDNDERYPTALANRKGQVLLVWQVGPMAVTGTATVRWALYGADAAPLGQEGVAGTSFAGTKASAFVGANDDFYIVTTAAGSSR